MWWTASVLHPYIGFDIFRGVGPIWRTAAVALPIRSGAAGRGLPRIKSAARSPIMIVAALVFDPISDGITELSQMRAT